MNKDNKDNKKSNFKVIFCTGNARKAANDARFNGGGDYTPPYKPKLGRGGLIWT